MHPPNYMHPSLYHTDSSFLFSFSPSPLLSSISLYLYLAYSSQNSSPRVEHGSSSLKIFPWAPPRFPFVLYEGGRASVLQGAEIFPCRGRGMKSIPGPAQSPPGSLSSLPLILRPHSL